MPDEPVDVLIVGAGASGAAVAWSLAETRMRIVCLEQGKMMNPAQYPSTGRDWEARGAVEIFVKDMGLAIDLAKEGGVELAVVPAARKMFQRAEAAGWGKDDATRVLEVYEGKDK